MTDTIPAWAVKGAKVVCVHACDDGPVLREICRISEVMADGRGPYAPYAYIEGYDGWVQTGPVSQKRTAYSVWHFRPLITRTQEDDVEMFRKIVCPVPA